MEEITIRKATLEDLDVLLRFEQGVIEAERPFDSTIKNDPVRYYDIQAMIQASHVQLVVAEINHIVVGCGYARIENARPFLKHALHAYLGFMYVEPLYRGKGVNSKIIETLKQWAITRNITEMSLEVYYGNESAIRAYEKIGFIRHMIAMRMGLSDH
ncbi:GNAT family N-acetyltransferase [Ohtaekwangia koreensis]|uniref:Ribosomal protein S18 acetylase RimI n=1 Tax=Ohtaekwangia koreensis TaxID=688867 RepID=A0A1T5MD43_9BACT|nr:GNAT family N-acetyltransferase [Ohtaekwangia koreensis]SKC86156.1 Ribosomal protein S18 acetylase RimI [Ohtaekwangia koreensis]